MKEKIYEYITNGKLNMEMIMQNFTNYIYTIIMSKSNNMSNEDIEEIISDVYLSLWNNQSKLDINKNLSPYIAGITKNLVKKKYRTIKSFENIEDYEERLVFEENIEIFSETTEKNEIVMLQIEKMKQEDKQIFIMFYYEHKKIREIACILDISESKIKSKLSRTRKKLKKVLERIK